MIVEEQIQVAIYEAVRLGADRPHSLIVWMNPAVAFKIAQEAQVSRRLNTTMRVVGGTPCTVEIRRHLPERMVVVTGEDGAVVTALTIQTT